MELVARRDLTSPGEPALALVLGSGDGGVENVPNDLRLELAPTTPLVNQLQAIVGADQRCGAAALPERSRF